MRAHPLVVNKHHPDCDFDVYVGRPTKWGNPFSHRDGTLAHFKVDSVEEAIEGYRRWLYAEVRAGRVTLRELAALKGKTLACWCAPGPCHAEVLVAASEWAATQLTREEVAA